MITRLKLATLLQTRTIFVVALLAISLFLSSVIPPFQSPDEFEHITRAYLLGHGDIVLKAQEGQSSGGMIDSGLARYMDAYSGLPFHPNRKLSATEIEAAKSIQWQDTKESKPALGMAYYFPGIYVVHTLGLKIGEFFKLSIDTSYYLTRYLLFIVIGLVLYFSFKLYAPSYLTLAFLLIPMSIFQFSSASLDGIATALAIFIISAVFFINGSANRISSETPSSTVPSAVTIRPDHLFYFLMLAFLLLASSRLQAMAMIFPVGVAAYSLKKRRYIIFTLLSAVAVFLWQVIIIHTIVDGRVAIGASSSSVILFYATHPIELWGVLKNTLTNADILRGYFSSFFGLLGWLDTPFPGSEYKILFFITLTIAGCSIAYAQPQKLSLLKVSLCLSALGSLAAIFLALLVTWTPHPARVIDGVVGRYLLIPALLLSYAFSTNEKNLLPALRHLGLIFLIGLGTYSLIICYDILLERYYLKI